MLFSEKISSGKHIYRKSLEIKKSLLKTRGSLQIPKSIADSSTDLCVLLTSLDNIFA